MKKRLAAFAGTVRRFVVRATCPHPVRTVNSEAYRPDMALNVYPATCERCGHEKYVTGAMVQADARKPTQGFDTHNTAI